MSRITTRWRTRIGVTLMASAIAVATAVAAGAPAGAQEAGAPEEAKETKITKAGFYDAPVLDALPPSILASFPPQVVCLVNPKPCTGDWHESQPDGTKENYNTLTGGVEDGMSTAQENDPHEPVSPVQDGTLPVSVTTGQPRYRSAFAFELPSVPEGHQVDDFRIYLTQTDPSGGVSSPMVRQAVLAFMTCVRGCQPDQFQKILTLGCAEGEEGPCPAEDEPLQMELCPIADDPFTEQKDAKWKGEPSQDPSAIPETDCFLGANGKLLDDGTTWEFDLTYAMEDWASGDLPNNGVLVTPQVAPNFAFGDPDSTFNKQVTFEQKVVYTIATSEAPEPVTFPSSSGGFDSGGTGTTTTTTSSGSGGYTAPSAGTTGNVSTFSAPANDTAPAQPAPEVAGGTPAQQPATEPVAAGPQEPSSAWYVWLLAPVFLGGMWLTAQSLTTAPAVSAVGSRSGAMSRLISQQQATAASSGPQLA